jgi:hypothetical protein
VRLVTKSVILGMLVSFPSKLLESGGYKYLHMDAFHCALENSGISLECQHPKKDVVKVIILREELPAGKN